MSAELNIISTQVVWQRHRANGEALILAIHADGLKTFHRATVLRWVMSGKIPAIKIGRRFLTCQSLVDEWIGSGKAANNEPYHEAAKPATKSKSKPRPKKSKAKDAHATAIESLRKKGLMG